VKNEESLTLYCGNKSTINIVHNKFKMIRLGT